MYLESVLRSFQVHVCFGGMWRLWSILELKNEETRSCSRNQSQSRELEGVLIDNILIVSLDTITRRRAKLDRDRLEQRSHHILQDYLWPTYYLLYMCLAIV